jgi:DNA replication protein DnaC
VKAGKAVYRCTLAELIEALGRAEREGRLTEKLRFYSRASLLIVDEIGYLPSLRAAPTSSSSWSTPATRRAP